MPTLRLMTWNVLHATPSEDEVEHPWKERRDAARAVVDRIRPDILCLQEALPEQTDFLLENLPHHWAVGRDRHGGNEDEGCPVAFDTRRFALLGRGELWLGPRPETPGSLTWANDVPRIATRVRLRDRATGSCLRVVNTHLDHLVPTSRTKAVELLEERLPIGTFEEPLLLAGDFNSPSWGKPHRILTRGPRRFHDARRVAARRPGPLAGTYHHFTGRGLVRVDWILTEPRLEVRRLEVVKDAPGHRWPSDHFPVVAEIEVAKKEWEEERARPDSNRRQQD